MRFAKIELPDPFRYRFQKIPTRNQLMMLIDGISSMYPSCDNVFRTYGKCDVCQEIKYVSILKLDGDLKCNVCADCWIQISCQRGIRNEQCKEETEN